MAEDLQRINPLSHLEQIAEEFEKRTQPAPVREKQNVVEQNQQSIAALAPAFAAMNRKRKPRV